MSVPVELLTPVRCSCCQAPSAKRRMGALSSHRVPPTETMHVASLEKEMSRLAAAASIIVVGVTARSRALLASSWRK